MTRRRSPRTLPAGVLVSSVLLLSLLAETSAGEDPWESLRTVRQGLTVDAPLTAEFVQTYVPAGFEAGERETGRLYVSLPDCLRWDYEEPYPRNYLLCGRTVWAWSPDEPDGDRFADVSVDEAGLDFLLLSAGRLAERYEATAAGGADGTVTLDLTPTSPETPFRHARIVLDLAASRPIEIAYEDHEGNETRFVLSSFAPQPDAAVFSPPEGLEWFDG
jgi:outer membrane lipoprotein-sorting protein